MDEVKNGNDTSDLFPEGKELTESVERHPASHSQEQSTHKIPKKPASQEGVYDITTGKLVQPDVDEVDSPTGEET